MEKKINYKKIIKNKITFKNMGACGEAREKSPKSNIRKVSNAVWVKRLPLIN